jgi:hypothetical protein
LELHSPTHLGLVGCGGFLLSFLWVSISVVLITNPLHAYDTVELIFFFKELRRDQWEQHCKVGVDVFFVAIFLFFLPKNVLFGVIWNFLGLQTSRMLIWSIIYRLL